MKEYIVVQSSSVSTLDDDGAPITPNFDRSRIYVSEGYRSYNEAKKALIRYSKAQFAALGKESVDSISISTTFYQSGDEGPREDIQANLEIHPKGSADFLEQIHYEIQEREAKPLKGYVIYNTFQDWSGCGTADDNTSCVEGPFNTLEEAIAKTKENIALEKRERGWKGEDVTVDIDFVDNADADGTCCYAFHNNEQYVGQYCFYINTL